MAVRRLLLATTLTTVTAAVFFAVGQYSAQRLLARQQAESEARIDALRAELHRSIAHRVDAAALSAAGTSGEVAGLQAQSRDAPGERHQEAVADRNGAAARGTAAFPAAKLRGALRVRQSRQDELRHRRLPGRGYFITVKHGVIVLPDEGEPAETSRRIESIRLSFGGRRVAARVVDAGDADVEVHSGDWAILKVSDPIDLPALKFDTDFAYEFAEPIFRLGNDYSKGIIVSTGYVGQRTGNGLVTCLTDGHPGVSGGGVLDRDGDLVGIPIGRMQGDYRFSFILPVRPEMFRKVPELLQEPSEAGVPAAQ